MTRVLFVVLAAAALVTATVAGHAHARPPAPSKKAPSHAGPPAWTRPAPPLPMLPRVGRVRIEPARDRVVVVEDITLPRGDWTSGPLDLFAAFGAPGPIAVDARLVTPATGGPDAHPEEVGEAVALEPAPHRTAGAALLLGKPQMSGVVAHLKEGQLRHVYGVGEVAILRLRSLIAAPAPDATGAHDVVVRLGAAGGQPLTLGRIQVASLEAQPGITRAEAHLCGPEASPFPLTVTVAGKAPARTAALAPELALRHPSDDLCVRWWGDPL